MKLCIEQQSKIEGCLDFLLTELTGSENQADIHRTMNLFNQVNPVLMREYGKAKVQYSGHMLRMLSNGDLN